MWQELPDRIYRYVNEKGTTVFCVVRFDADPPRREKKIINPVCSAKPKGGFGKDFWVKQAYPPPRPLYNLDQIVTRLDAPILVVEGEKAADAAAKMLPDYVVTTWAGGSSAVKLTSWACLQSRDVVLWPDNDAPGITAMKDVANTIGKGSKAAKSVRMIIDEVDDNFDPGFDLGDPYQDTYTPVEYMLDNAGEVDTSRMPDPIPPADGEEQLVRLELFLNKYAAVHMSGDHVFVDLSTASPRISGAIPYTYMSRFTLDQKEVDTFIDVTPDGKGKKRKFIDLFLESNRKTWLSGYIYDPSTDARTINRGNEVRLNLYCGLANPPKECDPSLYQCFIDHVYASCETKLEADYLLDWFAFKIQYPEQMIGTMVILSGRQGCGKTIVCDIVREIMGRHNAVKMGMDQLTSQFNSQYANKLLIDVEEYNPGNSKMLKDLREKVKNLVTSETMLVNSKGLPAYENPAFHSIVATTNSKTPEDISFDNRRMTFLRFDNPNLKTAGRLISDNDYFAPLYQLKGNPVALAGLCHWMANRNINVGRVTKPLDTTITEEAMEFVDDPAFAFLKSIAETARIPDTDEVPIDSENPFPLRNWPRQATALPRSTFSKMFRDFCFEIRRETISPVWAGRAMMKTLMRPVRSSGYVYPRGIPEEFDIDKLRRWQMINRQGISSEILDRSICIPDLAELRSLVDSLAGTSIQWSMVSEDSPETGTVVPFPAKATVNDPDDF